MLIRTAAVRKVTQQGRVSQNNGFYNFGRNEREACGGKASVWWVGQTLLSVRYDIATAHADRQECLSH